MTPLYFGNCFGWLHSASGGRGVVICPAMGLEELCTHRLVRHLADDLAEAGMPTLRFDYHGTGDSAGTDFDANRVSCWLGSIRQAVEALKRTTGVTEVALVGVRLGALLGAEVAYQLGDIHMLVLIGAVLSGKQYLAETRKLGLLIAHTPAMLANAARGDLECEAAGFYLTTQTANDLRKLSFSAYARSPAPYILVTGAQTGNDMKLAEQMRSLSSTVELAELPGYAAMEWNSSFASLPPRAFENIVRWLADQSPVHGAAKSTQLSERLVDGSWYEEPVRFGATGKLFGIHCCGMAQQATSHRHMVLFVNHGANHHIGWARLHVKLARHFAGLGIDSLRMDISGIGDSPAQTGYAENLLYARHSQFDVYAALDWIKRSGYDQITLIGHCSGAHLGFYSTLRDLRINNLVMLNMQRFFWARGDTLRIAGRQTFNSNQWYFRKLRDPETWTRLLKARINLPAIVISLTRRALQHGFGRMMNALGPLFGDRRTSRKVIRWLRELAFRRVRVLLIYSAEDSGLDELSIHTGSNARKARKLENIEFHVIQNADHNITPRWAQDEYQRLLDEFLSKHPDPHGSRS